MLEIVYIDIGGVNNLGQIVKRETFSFAAAPTRARRIVHDGDLIVSTIRTYLRAIAPIQEPAQGTIVSTGFAVVRPKDNLTTEYAAYALRCLYFVERVVANSKGVSFPAINESEMATFELVTPPSDEQSIIADFLDRETAKIDALVAKKERLIKLLQEKRTALITQAVTKGLDPNVPMKDSGVEWLGQVPEHWDILALSRITLSRCDGPFGSGLKSEHYSDDGVRVIRLQNIGWAEFLNTDKAYIEEQYASELGDHSVIDGDILIAGLGDERHPVGRACAAPVGIEPAMVKADCFRFRIDQRRLIPLYGAYQLSATATVAAGSSITGATRARMNLTTTAARKAIVPPLKEQQAIAQFIHRETAQLDVLAAKVREAIDRLKEYRTALISAAVTGKIDVREKVA